MMRLATVRFLSDDSHEIYTYKEVDHPFNTYVSYNVADGAESPTRADFPIVLYTSGSSNEHQVVTQQVSSVPYQIFTLAVEKSSPILFFVTRTVSTTSSEVSTLLDDGVAKVFFSFGHYVR